MQLIDSHVHLDRFPPAAVPGLLARAREVGVFHLVAVGMDLPSSAAALALAAQHPGVLPAAGLHPLRPAPARLDADLDALARLATRTDLAAIGEIGLDYSDGAPPAAAQRAAFAACLDLARAQDLAVSLHVVGADADALRLLERHGPPRAVIHYFVGGWARAEPYLARGCWLSVGKPVIRVANADLRALVARMPLDRLLLETDSYPLPGRATEPRDLANICTAVAMLRGEAADSIAAATMANTARWLGEPAVRRYGLQVPGMRPS